MPNHNFKIVYIQIIKRRLKDMNGTPLDKKGTIEFILEKEEKQINFFDRFNKPKNEFRKMLPEVINVAAKKNKIIRDDQKNLNPKNFKWSQLAGCCGGCTCSPGFIRKNVKTPFEITVYYTQN